MKFRKAFLTLLILAGVVFQLGAQISVSGLMDSSVFLRAGAGDSPDFSYGVEKYANLRMTARLREIATVFADVNLIAQAGDPAFVARMVPDASGMDSTPFVAGQNYIAGFELERLYFRINTDNARLDAGLTRIPFGHGLIWRPTDFLNPANPMLPNARPRGVLGAELSWWPTFDLKVVGFGSTPRDPFSRWGSGGHFGMTLEREWDNVVAKALYSFESPAGGDTRLGVHRAGLSVKADLELGFAIDALYTYNHEQGTGIEGLAFSAGFDYSLFRGRLLIMVDYLYNGWASSTSIRGGGNFYGEHFLYTGFTWLFSDFTNAGIALISGLSDISFTPMLTFSREIFQGATLNLTAQIPLDRHLFSGDGNRGELGPLPPDHLQPLLGVDGTRMGRYFDFTTTLRLRF